MTEEFFPEYGEHGDHIGARRRRHAFRFLLSGVLLFTVSLWFSEYFLRHDQAERLYLSALTFERDASARAFLRQAVRLDEQRNGHPAPKYVHALAEREESALQLETYARAAALDPRNADLAIQYGCALAAAGRFEEARARFSVASGLAPGNALPVYLEAAVMLYAEPEPGLAASLALLARANNMNVPVLVPKPLWSTELPRRGAWYADRRRTVARGVLQPLVNYAAHLCERSREDLSAGKPQYWESWLTHLEEAGERIAAGAWPLEDDNPEGGTAVQAQAGLRIAAMAVEVQEEWQASRSAGGEAGELDVRIAAVERSLAILDAFERGRDPVISRSTRAYGASWSVALRVLGVLTTAYLLAVTVCGVLRTGKTPWTLPHTGWAWWSLGAGGALFLLLLAAAPPVARNVGTDAAGRVAAILATAWLATGLAYPWIRLPRPPHANPMGRKKWRDAFCVTLRRYAGCSLGVALLSMCAWVVLHWAVRGLYPWQVNLLATGLGYAELESVRKALSMAVF